MRILIVGAGAVGQVYGHHLARGGAQVAFLVKPKYADALKGGLTLFRLRVGQKPVTEQMTGYQVLTGNEEVRRQRWDQVWLCVSTPALQGEWLAELLGAIGDATVISLQPGLGVQETILEAWRQAVGDGAEAAVRAQLVTGLITAVAYQSPLPGKTGEPGMAFWLPSPIPLSGPRERVRSAVSLLKAGGCPARMVDGVAAQAAFGSSILMPQIAALEASGWSLPALRKSPLLGLATRASRQMIDVAAVHLQLSPPAMRHVVTPWLLGTVWGVAPHVAPFDLEPYLQYHFTKVGDQTRVMLDKNMALGQQYGVETGAVAELAAALS